MNMKQFRRPANGHARMQNGRGRRGYRLMSKFGMKGLTITRLERLLSEHRARQTKGVPS